jgi:hypothetical protein
MELFVPCAPNCAQHEDQIRLGMNRTEHCDSLERFEFLGFDIVCLDEGVIAGEVLPDIAFARVRSLPCAQLRADFTLY